MSESWSQEAQNGEKMSSPKRKMSSSECASTSDDETWIQWFCNQRGNGYFCQVNMEFLDSNFNLSGLSDQVPHYQKALNTILDLEPEPDDTNADIIDQAAEFLYGLVHARFILTDKGMAAMIDKFEAGDFGCCPRVYCENQHRLPIGMSDVPGEHMVKLYCPRCEDIYTPKSTRHHHTDGAYFGTGFPHLLFMNYPHLRPPPPSNKHVPRLFGFKIHPTVDQVQRDEADIKQRAVISSVENVLKKVSGFY